MKEAIKKAVVPGWEYLSKRGIWELWKTPTKFLVCYHYGLQYYFYENERDAQEFLSLQSTSDCVDILHEK